MKRDREDRVAWQEVADRARDSTSMRTLKVVALSFLGSFMILATVKTFLETSRLLPGPAKDFVVRVVDYFALAGISLLLFVGVALLYELARFWLRRAPVGAWSVVQSASGRCWWVYLEPARAGQPVSPVAKPVDASFSWRVSVKVPRAARLGSVVLSSDGKLLAALDEAVLRVYDVVVRNEEPEFEYSGAEVRFEDMPVGSRVVAVEEAANNACWVAVSYRDDNSSRMHVIHARADEARVIDLSTVKRDRLTTAIVDGPGFGGAAFRVTDARCVQLLTLGPGEFVTGLHVRLRGTKGNSDGPKHDWEPVSTKAVALIKSIGVDVNESGEALLEPVIQREEASDAAASGGMTSSWLFRPDRESVSSFGDIMSLDGSDWGDGFAVAVLARWPLKLNMIEWWSWARGQAARLGAKTLRGTREAESGSFNELQLFVGSVSDSGLVAHGDPQRVGPRWAKGVLFIRRVGDGAVAASESASRREPRLERRILVTDGMQVRLALRPEVSG